jgi:hypothetical protein
MTRTMYDSIYANNLPEGGQLYAGYVDGNWPDYANVKAKFPHSVVVAIATNPNTDKGVVGDGPPDNGTWDQWIRWVGLRRAAGVEPTLNTNASNWDAGKAAFAAAKVAEPLWWIAHYDNDPAIPAGAIAKQYASNSRYDTSSVAAYWPGVDPKPVTPPPPVPTPVPTTEEDDMLILHILNVIEVYGLSGGRLWHIAHTADLEAYVGAGVKQVTISEDEFNNIKTPVSA